MKYCILILTCFLASCTKDFGQYELIDKVISEPDSAKTILQTGKTSIYPMMDSLYFYRDNSAENELY
ncbi:MAG TPA: hypothetical protein VEC36_10730 [Patescibacteria group bacterium]|nr:hypothetical protein [Patescibacteria group bacterium]